MHPEMAQLWENALKASARTSVPAPALVSAYLRLVERHAGQQLTADAIALVGEELVAELGTSALIDDHTRLARDQAIDELAARLGVSVAVAQGIYDVVEQRVINESA